MRLALLPLLCVLVSASCFRKKEYVYLPAVESCLHEAPPEEKQVVPTDVGCPEKFVMCLEMQAGLNLEHNVKALRRWNKEAWERCAVRAKPDGGQDVQIQSSETSSPSRDKGDYYYPNPYSDPESRAN